MWTKDGWVDDPFRVTTRLTCLEGVCRIETRPVCPEWTFCLPVSGREAQKSYKVSRSQQ